MNENIDLTNILKNCPKGWKFYSILYGEVKFEKITKESEYPIVIITKHGNNSSIKSDGRHYEEYDDGECTLFPSKDQRDWSKFTAPWYKKERNTIAQLKEQDEKKEPQVYETEDDEIITYSETDGYKFVEPNFHKGDWVVRGGTLAQIVDIQEQYYIGLDINGKDFVSSRFLNDDKIHLWTIQDVKDGDVLVNGSNIFIFRDINNKCLMGYCHVNMDDGNLYNDIGRNECFCTIDAPITPATKEQHDALMKAMNEAGYELDVEKKKLKKLIPNKFDPKILKPFDKVLVRDSYSCSWRCAFYSHTRETPTTLKYVTENSVYECCIPYNNDTKHLIGTTKEAPKYYRYWEN